MLMKSIKFIILAFGLFLSLTVYADSPINSILRQPNDPVAGNPKGKVTIVEFFDYQCSHCSNMAPVIASIIKANPNVRVVFKEYPIFGGISEFATRAALAANMQKKYYLFNHALLTSNLAMNENNIYDIAKSLGLNVEKLKSDMKSPRIKNQVNANYALARRLNITGTPSFFIGKTQEQNSSNLDFVSGEMSQSELQDSINKAS